MSPDRLACLPGVIQRDKRALFVTVQITSSFRLVQTWDTNAGSTPARQDGKVFQCKGLISRLQLASLLLAAERRGLILLPREFLHRTRSPAY